MKWLSRVVLGAGIISLVLLAGYTQFGRDVQEANADVVVTPWPTSATTGTHLMVVSMTVSSTWIAPNGVTSVIVEAWGAGGPARPSVADACGGGGAYVRSLVSVTPGDPYWIQVGGQEPRATSTFATTTVVAAPGWSWTNGGSGGAAASSTGDVKFSGGAGLGATSGRGSSAGDNQGIVGADSNGGESNGAPPGSNTTLVQTVPGSSGCDQADPGARGLVRLTYSSTSLVSFPYVRARNWQRIFGSFLPTIKSPTSTQVDDVLLAMVTYGIQAASSDVPAPVCFSNCGGWSKVFSSSTSFGGVSLFKKQATSSLGNDFVATGTNSGGNLTYSYFVLSVANADLSDISFATSSAPTAVYGNPPLLDTGVSKKYLWLYGSNSGGQTNGTPFCPNLGTTGTMILSPRNTDIGKGMTWWESFIEASSLDPGEVPPINTALCTGTASRDWFAYTVAIAGLAAAPGGSPTFLQRPQRIINIW